MTAAIDGALGWLDSSEALLGLFLAAGGTALSGWFSWHQRNMARRERAADLFDRFYSLESYHAMVAPVFVIMLKWNALRGEARSAYAATLCKGWAGPERAPELLEAWEPGSLETASGAGVEAFDEAHFRRSRAGAGVTGHAALTAFLYFWVKLDAMIDARLVSRRLTRQLFGGPYAIYARFLADFREAVLEHPVAGGERPAWIGATRRLERLLLGRELAAVPADGPREVDPGGGIGPSAS